MLNPPNSQQDSGSYVDLLKRMTQAVKGTHAPTQMLDTLRVVFEVELAKQHLVLSSAEIERLFRQVARAVLTDMMTSLDVEK